MSGQSSRIRIGVFVGLWAAVSAVVFLAPGCYGRNCEGSVEYYGSDAGQGVMIDENTWASTPLNSDWLPFPRQHVYVFDIPALGGRMPEIPTAFISAVQNPTVAGDMVTGAGNLAKMSLARPGGINVYNDSCSDYYLRLTIQMGRLPPTLDGGEETPPVPDAAPTDASDAGDAGDDGGT
jgi:hypothetical protein